MMSFVRASASMGLAMLFVAACGGSNDATNAPLAHEDASTPSDGGTNPVPTNDAAADSATATVTPLPLPQVISGGGSVIATPKVQLLIPSTDVDVTQVEAFLHEMTTSSYWSDTTSEYGVGPLTILPTITLTTAPTVEADILNLISANTTGAEPAWGPIDPNTIYLYLPPKGSGYVDGTGDACCNDYDGYHGEAGSGSDDFTYAISCTCAGGFDGPGVDDFQQRTVSMSHELIEAATDPRSDSAPAYVQTDNDDIVWTIASGGELADMCEFNPDAYVIPSDGTFMVQRSWSNAAAKAFKEPCVPATSPFFFAQPILTSKARVTNITTDAVAIAIGKSETIDVQLVGDVSDGPWDVHAVDFDEDLNGAEPTVTLAFDKSSGNAGDVLHLTISPIRKDASLYGEVFLIYASNGAHTNLSMGLVNN